MRSLRTVFTGAVLGILVACSGSTSSPLLEETAPDAAISESDGAVTNDGAVDPPDGGPPDAAIDADASDAGTCDETLDPSATTPGAAVAQNKNLCPVAYRTTAPVAGSNIGFTVAGQERSFVLITPPSTFTGPRPLLVAFHGTGSSGLGFSSGLKLAESFAAKGFVVVAPNGAGNGTIWPVWDAHRTAGTEAQPNKDLDFFDALVGCTAAHFSIDASRIFVLGHSAGGSFANKVLRARSSVLAGGLVGSGVFSLTGNGTNAPLSEMFVVVTWGGDNDQFTGGLPGGPTVKNFNFVEEAALATAYYEAQPNVAQTHCRGNGAGHSFLPLTTWLANNFSSHPKGKSKDPTALPKCIPATCATTGYQAPPLPPIACGASATNGCREQCQLMADCVGENRTISGTLQDQLTTAGIAGGTCNACLTKCAAATGAANASVLACLKTAQGTAQCGGGLQGSLPYLDAINTCCKNRSDASFCVSTCTSLNQATGVAAFVPTCKQIAP